jgi:hypothetical protein
MLEAEPRPRRDEEAGATKVLVPGGGVGTSKPNCGFAGSFLKRSFHRSQTLRRRLIALAVLF